MFISFILPCYIHADCAWPTLKQARHCTRQPRGRGFFLLTKREQQSNPYMIQPSSLRVVHGSFYYLDYLYGIIIIIEISLERKNWNEVEVKIIMQNYRHIRWNNSNNIAKHCNSKIMLIQMNTWRREWTNSIPTIFKLLTLFSKEALHRINIQSTQLIYTSKR